MIKSKKCSLCDKPAFSKGLCQQHSKGKKLESNNTLIKYGKLKIKNSRQKTVENKKERSELREVYFDYHISRCTHSELSGKPINDPTRTNICHIIPKGTHPSVQDNLDNYLYLDFREHERFDKLLFSHEFDKIEIEFEKILDLICIRVNKFIHLCEENTNLKRELEKWIQTLK